MAGCDGEGSLHTTQACEGRVEEGGATSVVPTRGVCATTTARCRVRKEECGCGVSKGSHDREEDGCTCICSDGRGEDATVCVEEWRVSRA